MSAGSSRRRTCSDCDRPVCSRSTKWCDWHWISRQGYIEQEQAAATRRRRQTAKVPRAQWPAGWRWCSGCSSLVPEWYCSGSRCRPCDRLARRSGHVERTYGISGNEERALRSWQGNRCFICGRAIRRRELAVDHDHATGAVRGLLCSDDNYGCNVLLRRLLGDEGAAQRLVAYVQKPPLERMRDGEPPWSWTSPEPEGDPPPF